VHFHVFCTLPGAQCAIEKFTKKLLGESDVEAVLARLDRLTQDEARMTAAQTLGVVHGLVGNVRAVMEGEQCLHDLLLTFYWILVQSDGKASTDGIRRDLGMYLTKLAYLCSYGVVVVLHQMLNEMNKMKRLLFLYSTIRS
jgi:hypothetical protein